MKAILALDQGTTSTRALIVDAEAHIRAIAQVELPQIYPQPGWIEHDAETIWRDVVATAREALAKAESHGLDVVAVGITNQRETFVLWNRATGKPLHHAIVWQDRRGAELCRDLIADGIESEVTERTGLLLDSYFSASKLAWLLDTMPEARKLAESGQIAFGTIDSYLLWKLTGGSVHATDPTNAARTLLFDIRAMRWCPELCRIFNVPRQILPEVRSNDAFFGNCDLRILGRALPVTGMAGDQQAALVGLGCLETGRTKITYGTGGFALMNTGDTIARSSHRLLSTVGFQAEGRTCYALEGSIFVAGAGVRWLRDGLGVIEDAAQSEAMASSLADNGGVYLVPAFVGLGAPHWDPDARAIISGLTLGSTAAHLVRAALEAVAYQSCELIETMVSDSSLLIEMVQVDGGMAVNNWLCQFLADMLARVARRPSSIEATAMGAAYLSGVGAGMWSSLSQVCAMSAAGVLFQPSIEPSRRDLLFEGWRKSVEQARQRP